jgi:hypothetical protein
MISIIHWDGTSEPTPDIGSLGDLFDELATADREHGDVSVVDEESGWCMTAHRDGRLVFENLSMGGERHMKPVSKDRVLQLWRLLADDQIEAILREPWVLGYGT